MALLKLLNVIIIFMSITALIAAENISDYRLPDYIAPIEFDIFLEIKDDSSENITGAEMKTRFYILRPTHHIVIQASKNVHIQTSLAASQIGGASTDHNRYYHIYNNDTEMLVSFFLEELPSGEYSTHLDFDLDFSEGDMGLYKSAYYTNKKGDKVRMYATCFPPFGARRVFPCWDEPQLRANFKLGFRVNQNYTVLANVPNPDIRAKKDGRQWRYVSITDTYPIIFPNTPAIPTHLVAFAVVPDDLPHLRQENIAMYYRDDQKQYIMFAWNVATNVTKNLKYKLPSLKMIVDTNNIMINQVVIPGYPVDGTSNYALIFYREDAIIYDKAVDFNIHKIKVAHLVARQVAYQWFGNLVSPSGWSYLWLHEGLARFVGADTIDNTKIFRNIQVMHLFIVQNQYEAFHLHPPIDNNKLNMFSFPRLLSVEINSLSQMKSVFSLPPFTGISILYMSQHILTNKVFQYGIHKFLYMHACNSTTPDDFSAAMQETLHYFYSKVDMNFTKIFSDWAKLREYPILNVTRDYEKNLTDVREIKSINSMTPIEKQTLKIPVSFTTQSELNFTKTSFHNIMWLERKPQLSRLNDGSYYQFSFTKVLIPTNNTDWIIINLQQTGHYRVHYDRKNWEKLISYLNSTEYVKIHVLNRAKLIDDAFHFINRRDFGTAVFWDLADYLGQETDYIAWYPMFKALECMSSIFAFPKNSIVISIKIRLSVILNRLLKIIDSKENSTENYLTKCLRLEVIKWLCFIGDAVCTSLFSNNLQEHLAYPVKYKLLPEWKQWTLCKGLAKSNKMTWNKLLSVYKESSSNQILEYLACSDNVNIISDFLPRMVQFDENTESSISIDRVSHVHIFLSIIARHAKNEQIFDYILQNFDKIRPTKGGKIAVAIVMINNVYYEPEFEKVVKFVVDDIRYLEAHLRIKIGKREDEIIYRIDYLQTIYPEKSRNF